MMRIRLLPLSIAASAGLVATPAWALAENHDPAQVMAVSPHHSTPGAPLPVGQMPVGQMPAPALPPMPGDMAATPAGPAGAYPPEYQRARAEWVNECSRRYRSDHRRGGEGGIIGGLLGAVAGGIAGNRIDNHGSRLAGTLIGAGVGGVAGAVIGSVIDRGGKSKAENEALDWCEDYLARNSAPQGYGQPYAYPPMAYQGMNYAMAYPYGPPMMMQPVMIPVQRCHEHEVVERVVEKPVYRTVTKRRIIREKRVKMQPTKTVKYVKTIK